jgi:hypothetical protein
LFTVQVSTVDGGAYDLALPRALIRRQGERPWEALVAERGIEFMRELLRRHARPSGACKAVMPLDELAKLAVQTLEEVEAGEEEPQHDDQGRVHLPPAGEVPGDLWGAGKEVQPPLKFYAAGAVAPPDQDAVGAGAAPEEPMFKPVRLGMRGGMEVPVRAPPTMREECAALTPVMDAVHRSISANHNNRRELRKAIDTSTLCSKLLALEETMPLGVIVLAESAKAQCDHQLQMKTAETVISEATQKVSGH